MAIDYDTVDQVLDTVEPILHEIAGRNSLAGARIERWIWDAPVIVLSWHAKQAPHIGRNIAFRVTDSSGAIGPSVLADIEVNAWLDEDGRRRWQHTVTSSGVRIWSLDELEGTGQPVREFLDEAYKIVASWTVEDLKRESALRSYHGAGPQGSV